MMSLGFSIAGELKEASEVVLECGPIGMKELDLCMYSLTRKIIPIQIIHTFRLGATEYTDVFFPHKFYITVIQECVLEPGDIQINYIFQYYSTILLNPLCR